MKQYEQLSAGQQGQEAGRQQEQEAGRQQGQDSEQEQKAGRQQGQDPEQRQEAGRLQGQDPEQRQEAGRQQGQDPEQEAGWLQGQDPELGQDSEQRQETGGSQGQDPGQPQEAGRQEYSPGQCTDSHAQPHKDPHTPQHNPVHAPIPGLGLRSMKTALATVVTALLYAFLPGSNPTFACIGAIFGMGADMEESRRSGGNRFFGTVIGGFIGLALYWLEHLVFPEGCYWLRLPMVFLGVIILISMCVLFHWPGGVQPGGVVLCIILFNTPAHHIEYAIHRMIDTGIGVIIALLVNYFLPRSRLEHWFHLDQERRRKKKENGRGRSV